MAQWAVSSCGKFSWPLMPNWQLKPKLGVGRTAEVREGCVGVHYSVSFRAGRQVESKIIHWRPSYAFLQS